MRIAVMILPWLELFTLIELGVKTSALTALSYVFATLLLGIAILRRQGRGMLERLRQGQDGSVIGPQLLVDDVAMGFAGVLLMIPGMITDLVACIVVIGPLRRRLARMLSGPQPEAYIPERDEGSRSHETLEGIFRTVDDDSKQ
jgi:UPF0716 protein FxsA